MRNEFARNLTSARDGKQLLQFYIFKHDVVETPTTSWDAVLEQILHKYLRKFGARFSQLRYGYMAGCLEYKLTFSFLKQMRPEGNFSIQPLVTFGIYSHIYKRFPAPLYCCIKGSNKANTCVSAIAPTQLHTSTPHKF